MRPAGLQPEAHERRAEHHYSVGAALHEAADNEWAAVAYFYAAYHLMKAALLTDPIFNDPSKCSAKHIDLTVEDRHTSRHRVRKPQQAARGWGINDLVLVLYRDIVGDYERLHQASVDVRYREGLLPAALPALRLNIDKIRAAYAAGSIRTP